MVIGYAKPMTLPRQRMRIDGLCQYTALVMNADGTPASMTEFSDWFANDEEAVGGFAAIMDAQGYKVVSVTIGFPCVVTLQ